MTLEDYYYRQLPEYYPTMYMDGYTPQEVYAAFHRKMKKRWAEERNMDRVHITVESKVKK